MQPERGGTRAEDVLLYLVEIGVFSIDEEGRIWRHQNRVARRWHTEKRTRCEPRRAEHPTTDGYLQIRASAGGVRYLAQAHRIVYRYFVGPIPDGYTINHQNGRHADNRPCNLEPATPTEQTHHARYVLGHNPTRYGEEHHNSKLTARQVFEIRTRRASGEQLKTIAADFGVLIQTVSRIARGEAWRAV